MNDKIDVKDITFGERSFEEVNCPLPYNHMNWHPNGKISVCCVAEMFPPNDGFYRDANSNSVNLMDTTIKSAWEESNIQTFRNQMRNGIKPHACHDCYQIENNGGISRRNREVERWGHRTESSLEFIDLRMSNLCNSSCMMCNPDSSSALIKDFNNWSKDLDFVGDGRRDYALFQWFNDEKIDELMEFKDELKYLYINGGEPFMMPAHWKFLERLIEEGVSQNIKISYNTNCSLYDPEYDNVWKHFDVVTLGLSVDGIDEKNKWIRSPINSWESIQSNVENLLRTPSISHMNITCTLQWLNLPFMDEFYDWAIPMTNLKKGTRINQNFLSFPHYLSVNSASIEWKQRLLSEFKHAKNKQHILSQNMVSYLNSNTEDHTLWQQGVKFMDTVSKSRGNWKEVFDYHYFF